MNLTTIIEPEFEPVNLADAYGHLRLDPSDSPPVHPDDAMLLRHITTARRFVEQKAQRSLVRQKLRLSASTLCVPLLRPPLISVASVQYYDDANALQSLPSSDWYVTDDLVPRLMLSAGAYVTHYSRRDAVQVDYWAGYPTDESPDGTDRASLIANVPSEAKDAILLGVQLLYDSLSTSQRADIERAQGELIKAFKVWTAG